MTENINRQVNLRGKTAAWSENQNCQPNCPGDIADVIYWQARSAPFSQWLLTKPDMNSFLFFLPNPGTLALPHSSSSLSLTVSAHWKLTRYQA